MAEDWGTWQKEWDRLAAKGKGLSLAGAQKRMAAVDARDKLLQAHEKTFVKAVQKAWEAGVKAKVLDEFLKNRDVVAAKKALDSDRRQLVIELNEVRLCCEACEALVKQVDKLTDAMARAIKGSKDKGPGRDRVKAVFAEAEARRHELHEAAHLDYKLDKFLLAFDAQYDKWIGHVLAQALKKTKEEEDLPAPLEDKALKQALLAARELSQTVAEALGQALAARADARQRAAEVKRAQQALTELKALSARHQGFLTKFKTEIALAKERKEIEGGVAAILERFRGAETEFKKAVGRLKGQGALPTGPSAP